MVVKCNARRRDGLLYVVDRINGQVNHNLIYRVQAARVKSALRTTDCVADWLNAPLQFYWNR